MYFLHVLSEYISKVPGTDPWLLYALTWTILKPFVSICSHLDPWLLYALTLLFVRLHYSVAICSHFHRVAFIFHLQYSSTCRVLIASARKPLFDLWQWWVCRTISAISCLQWLCSMAFASMWSIQWIYQIWVAWHLAPQGYSFLDKMD